MAADRPILWQLPVSHFNEKVRWALDYKGIEHERCSVVPGYHQFKAWRLSGGKTLPVLELQGRRIRNSSDIVAALEQYKPDPALYPSDPAERSAALEAEAFFDPLGHEVRRVLFQELLQDPALFVETYYVGQPEIVKRGAQAGFAFARPVLRRNYGVNPETAVRARDKVTAALDRIEQDLEPSGFLVGDSFSIADLTAAAILFPLVAPKEYPYPFPDPARWPAGPRRFRESVRDRPGFRWVEDIWQRRRSASAELVAA